MAAQELHGRGPQGPRTASTSHEREQQAPPGGTRPSAACPAASEEYPPSRRATSRGIRPLLCSRIASG